MHESLVRHPINLNHAPTLSAGFQDACGMCMYGLLQISESDIIDALETAEDP
jgi:hypothetical protein